MFWRLVKVTLSVVELPPYVPQPSVNDGVQRGDHAQNPRRRHVDEDRDRPGSRREARLARAGRQVCTTAVWPAPS